MSRATKERLQRDAARFGLLPQSQGITSPGSAFQKEVKQRGATGPQLAYREKLFGWRASATVQRLSNQLDRSHVNGLDLTARVRGALLIRQMAREGL